MDDLISRQEAIEAINSHFGFNIEEEYGSAVQEVINGLPSAQPEQRWIPVSERLPEHNQRIIAYYPEHKSTMVINYNAHGFTSMSAWRPLPEPYKAERG